MTTKSTALLVRYRHRSPNTDDPMNDAFAKPQRRALLAGRNARWRNAQVIKVSFAVERSIEVAIGRCDSSLGKKSKSYSQGHPSHD